MRARMPRAYTQFDVHVVRGYVLLLPLREIFFTFAIASKRRGRLYKGWLRCHALSPDYGSFIWELGINFLINRYSALSIFTAGNQILIKVSSFKYVLIKLCLFISSCIYVCATTDALILYYISSPCSSFLEDTREFWDIPRTWGAHASTATYRDSLIHVWAECIYIMQEAGCLAYIERPPSLCADRGLLNNP